MLRHPYRIPYTTPQKPEAHLSKTSSADTQNPSPTRSYPRKSPARLPAASVRAFYAPRNRNRQATPSPAPAPAAEYPRTPKDRPAHRARCCKLRAAPPAVHPPPVSAQGAFGVFPDGRKMLSVRTWTESGAPHPCGWNGYPSPVSRCSGVLPVRGVQDTASVRTWRG